MQNPQKTDEKTNQSTRKHIQNTQKKTANENTRLRHVRSTNAIKTCENVRQHIQNPQNDKRKHIQKPI